MQSVDGDVRLSVSFDMKSVQTNLVQLKKAIKDTLGGFDSVGSKVTPQVADLEKELANATDKINELTKEVEELSKTKLDKTFDGADKQVEKATNEAKELKAHTEGIADSAKDVNAEYDETAKEMERIAELAKKQYRKKMRVLNLAQNISETVLNINHIKQLPFLLKLRHSRQLLLKNQVYQHLTQKKLKKLQQQ